MQDHTTDEHNEDFEEYALTLNQAKELLTGVTFTEMEDASWTWSRPEDEGQYVALAEWDWVEIHLTKDSEGKLVLSGTTTRPAPPPWRTRPPMPSKAGPWDRSRAAGHRWPATTPMPCAGSWRTPQQATLARSSTPAAGLMASLRRSPLASSSSRSATPELCLRPSPVPSGTTSSTTCGPRASTTAAACTAGARCESCPSRASTTSHRRSRSLTPFRGCSGFSSHRDAELRPTQDVESQAFPARFAATAYIWHTVWGRSCHAPIEALQRHRMRSRAARISPRGRFAGACR